MYDEGHLKIQILYSTKPSILFSLMLICIHTYSLHRDFNIYMEYGEVNKQ